LLHSVGIDLPGVPEITRVPREQLERRCDHDLVGGLPHAAGAGFGLENPSEPRMEFTDPLGIRPIFATQVNDGHVRDQRRGRAGGKAEQNRENSP
jgi:hypothetical protein